MNKNINKEFANQIKELNNDWIETPHGIFTSNTHLGLTAQEVYEKWLYDKENPKPIQPTLEEIVAMLQEENQLLRENQKAILAGDMQTLAYNLYPEDFKDIK